MDIICSYVICYRMVIPLSVENVNRRYIAFRQYKFYIAFISSRFRRFVSAFPADSRTVNFYVAIPVTVVHRNRKFEFRRIRHKIIVSGNITRRVFPVNGFENKFLDSFLFGKAYRITVDNAFRSYRNIFFRHNEIVEIPEPLFIGFPIIYRPVFRPVN